MKTLWQFVFFNIIVPMVVGLVLVFLMNLPNLIYLYQLCRFNGTDMF